jgi:hypothetical protein
MSPAAWGLCLNMLGTGMVFFVGFPQPSHEEGVAILLSPANVLASGETVAQYEKRIRRRKTLYYGASHVALALILVGFALQLLDILVKGQ